MKKHGNMKRAQYQKKQYEQPVTKKVYHMKIEQYERV